jgi:hypothetical protein
MHFRIRWLPVLAYARRDSRLDKPVFKPAGARETNQVTENEKWAEAVLQRM